MSFYPIIVDDMVQLITIIPVLKMRKGAIGTRTASVNRGRRSTHIEYYVNGTAC